MKTEIETTKITETESTISQMLRQNHGTAPSLRVPVTISNRALLRELRAAELSAWEAADRHPHRSVRPEEFYRQTCVA